MGWGLGVCLMVEELKRFLRDDSGPELIEWALVTIILILAIYALLQAVGPDLQRFFDSIAAKLR